MNGLLPDLGKLSLVNCMNTFYNHNRSSGIFLFKLKEHFLRMQS